MAETESGLRFHGNGTFMYPGGEVYEGEWKDGKRNGKGKMTYGQSSRRIIHEVYEGDWEDGKRNGKGKMTYSKWPYSSGEVYEGDWEDDKRNGKGKMTYSSGAVY